MSAIKDLLNRRRLMRNAIRAVYEKLAAEERRKAEYARLVKTPLNYAILQDLINSCYYTGVAINVTLLDGSKLEIVRRDEFDRLVKQRAGLAGEDF